MSQKLVSVSKYIGVPFFCIVSVVYEILVAAE
jgi:hypothetical protein